MFGKVRFGILLLFLAVIAWGNPFLRLSRYQPQEGDLVFQSLPANSDLVKAIEGVTESPYSHCGVVIKKDGEWFVNEAISDVHSTPIFEWIRRGRWAKFDVYRLKPEFQKHIPKFIESLEPYQGRPYDFRYRLKDDAIYCSELIYHAFYDASEIHLGKTDKLGHLNWKPYTQTIIRYEGGDPPLDRDMITPIGLSKAPQLMKVYGKIED